MTRTPLQKRNIEHAISEFERDEAILGTYAEKGFQTIQHAMNWISQQIISLEYELEDEE